MSEGANGRTGEGAAAGGLEWIVEASGCDPEALSDRARLGAFMDRLIAEMGLHPVASPAWHVFPSTGGLTGFYLLAESHLAWHTFPEHGSLCLDLFCCCPRPDWDFRGNLAREIGARQVSVRRLARPFAHSPARPLAHSL